MAQDGLVVWRSYFLVGIQDFFPLPFSDPSLFLPLWPTGGEMPFCMVYSLWAEARWLGFNSMCLLPCASSAPLINFSHARGGHACVILQAPPTFEGRGSRELLSVPEAERVSSGQCPQDPLVSAIPMLRSQHLPSPLVFFTWVLGDWTQVLHICKASTLSLEPP